MLRSYSRAAVIASARDYAYSAAEAEDEGQQDHMQQIEFFPDDSDAVSAIRTEYKSVLRKVTVSAGGLKILSMDVNNARGMRFFETPFFQELMDGLYLFDIAVFGYDCETVPAFLSEATARYPDKVIFNTSTQIPYIVTTAILDSTNRAAMDCLGQTKRKQPIIVQGSGLDANTFVKSVHRALDSVAQGSNLRTDCVHISSDSDTMIRLGACRTLIWIWERQGSRATTVTRFGEKVCSYFTEAVGWMNAHGGDKCACSSVNPLFSDEKTYEVFEQRFTATKKFPCPVLDADSDFVTKDAVKSTALLSRKSAEWILNGKELEDWEARFPRFGKLEMRFDGRLRNVKEQFKDHLENKRDPALLSIAYLHNVKGCPISFGIMTITEAILASPTMCLHVMRKLPVSLNCMMQWSGLNDTHGNEAEARLNREELDRWFERTTENSISLPLRRATMVTEGLYFIVPLLWESPESLDSRSFGPGSSDHTLRKRALDAQEKFTGDETQRAKFTKIMIETTMKIEDRIDEMKREGQWASCCKTHGLLAAVTIAAEESVQRKHDDKYYQLVGKAFCSLTGGDASPFAGLSVGDL